MVKVGRTLVGLRDVSDVHRPIVRLIFSLFVFEVELHVLLNEFDFNWLTTFFEDHFLRVLDRGEAVGFSKDVRDCAGGAEKELVERRALAVVTRHLHVRHQTVLEVSRSVRRIVDWELEHFGHDPLSQEHGTGQGQFR